MEQFYNCVTKEVFEELESNCCELLGLPNEETTNFAKPLIDKFGNYWLLINSDVQSILTEDQLADCKPFNEIELNNTL